MLALCVATPAHASQNSGWVWTSTRSGAVYFDADLNGRRDWEKITICLNKPGHPIQARVHDGRHMRALVDTTADGRCVSRAGDFFPEERDITVYVHEIWDNREKADTLGEGSARS
ncbi:hypothetical protein [Nonomuraea sp. NPDC050786]|uniref:hypothetical protein n=1 Tax=Nonomuraea sp. NPDC050786 TaxID=3154840 RepID=UPI0033C36726